MPMSDYVRNLRHQMGHDVLMMVAASAVVLNDRGEVLLHRRSDNGLWWLPGGTIDPGEEPADAACREVWEETGVEVVPERICGVYSRPTPHYYANGDAITGITISFVCRPVGGDPRINDSESLEVRYFPLDALPDLQPWARLRIEDALRGDPRAIFRFSAKKEEKNES